MVRSTKKSMLKIRETFSDTDSRKIMESLKRLKKEKTVITWYKKRSSKVKKSAQMQDILDNGIGKM